MSLEGPLYGATFGESVRRFFRTYADFTGRASRSEFWLASSRFDPPRAAVPSV